MDEIFNKLPPRRIGSLSHIMPQSIVHWRTCAKPRMIQHTHISNWELSHRIRRMEICFGGNRKLKIYGTLQCSSGKRMKRDNRIFFSSEQEAIQNTFRPCGHCLKSEYQKWKNGFIR